MRLERPRTSSCRAVLPQGSLAVAGAVVLLFAGCSAPASSTANLRTRNVILVTVDGLRAREVFGGADPELLSDKKSSGIENPERIRNLFGGDTPEKRRVALLPHFWTHFAPHGVVFGDTSRGNRAVVENPHRVSYPGYAEILAAGPLAQVRNNDRVRIPHETVLEYVRRRLDLPRRKAAAFASWEVFRWITAREGGAIVSNAGLEPLPEDLGTPAARRLEDLAARALLPWDTVRHDAFTAGIALEYLRRHRPRFLYVALDETDDWAHSRRYDRVLEAARVFDDFLARLDRALAELEEYRGKTTVIITTDHGRGRTAKDWTDHGKIEGAEEIWIAVRGPDTPALGVVEGGPQVVQGSVGSTILALFGLDPKDFRADARPPLERAFRRSSAGTVAGPSRR